MGQIKHTVNQGTSSNLELALRVIDGTFYCTVCVLFYPEHDIKLHHGGIRTAVSLRSNGPPPTYPEYDVKLLCGGSVVATTWRLARWCTRDVPSVYARHVEVQGLLGGR